MNLKKLTFIFITFLTFIASGLLLSNVQSREADQLLEAHGLDNNTRSLNIESNENIKSFLEYLSQKYHQKNLQVHFESKLDKKQVLIWANHNIHQLPTQRGRYFNSADFNGKVSFAVLGPDVKRNVIEVQNNQYIRLNNRYYSVIGEFKNYHQIGQQNYYLSTGINQTTANEKLRNYTIYIDGPVAILRRIAKKYQTKLIYPSFVKKRQFYRLSVVHEIILILLLFVLALITNALVAIIDYRQSSLTRLKANLFRNWFINKNIRLILMEAINALIAFFLLNSCAFFNKVDHLAILLAINLIVAITGYEMMGLYLLLKEKK